MSEIMRLIKETEATDNQVTAPAPQADDEGWIKVKMNNRDHLQSLYREQPVQVREPDGSVRTGIWNDDAAVWPHDEVRLLVPAAERDALAAKLAEVERERDEWEQLAEAGRQDYAELCERLSVDLDAPEVVADEIKAQLATARDEALEEVCAALVAWGETQAAHVIQKLKAGHQ